jgi:hypothetical protein
MAESIPDTNPDLIRITSDPNQNRRIPSDSVSFLISPSPIAQYDEMHFSGGANEQLTVITKVVVTAFMPHSLDEPDDIKEFFAGNNSINTVKINVLRALSGKNIYDDNYDLPLLNVPLRPIEHSWVKDKSSGDIQISFHVEYDEDLRDIDDGLPGVN